MLQCSRADRSALGHLFDELAPQILGVVSRILLGSDRSEEAVRAIFVGIWRQSPRFDPQRTPALEWIASIVDEHLAVVRSGWDDTPQDTLDESRQTVAD